MDSMSFGNPRSTVDCATSPAWISSGGRRRHYWRADLTSLGYDSSRLSKLARCTDLPTYHSPEMLLGGLYVTEGSTLGGRFLAQHFRKTLGLHPGAGVSFFSSYEGEVGSMWNRFRSSLMENVAADKESHVVRGAILTFECMHSWLCSERAVLA